MEFFENAHHNRGPPNKKEPELKKKQLKRMLEGYKTHNTDMIKNSEYVTLDRETDQPMVSAIVSEIIEEIENSKLTLNESMNSVQCIDSSESEKFNYKEVKKFNTKTDFPPKSVNGSVLKRKKSALKVDVKKQGKVVLDEKVLKNGTHCNNPMEQTDRSENSSPLFVSLSSTDVNSKLNDVFDDYSEIHTESFMVKGTQSSDYFLNTDSDLFSVKKFKKNKIKYIEADGFDVNKSYEKSANCNVNDSVKDEGGDGFEKNRQLEKLYDDLSQESQLNEAHSIISFPYKTFVVRDGCLILLKHPAEIYLHGKAKVIALGGTAEILGYRMMPSRSCEIYAPHNRYALILKTVEVSNNYYGLFSKLTSLGLSVPETEDVVTTLGVHDAILYFQKLPTRKLDLVNSAFRDYMIPNSDTGKSVLDCTIYSETPHKCFYENPLWASISDYNSDIPARGIVCGGKGAGKSTFLKYFVNRQLNYGPVLVIDLDPGQCEFTVAGNISATVVKEPIIGPNYTHLRTPDRMLHIGMINVMDNLKRYITAIKKLLGFCKKNGAYAELPWIVNTMGMCNAIGLKLMLYIIFSLKPTFVLQIDFESSKKKFEYELHPQNVKMLHSTQFESEPLFNEYQNHYLEYTFFTYKQHIVSTELQSSFSPKDERYFNYLAYFGELLDKDKSAVSLLGVIPYVAPLKSLYIGSNTEICENFMNKVLNGKIIALCQHLPNSLKKIFKLSNEPLVCLGYGLVRGIDIHRGLLYVLTPITQVKLSEVTCIVYSDWTPEISSDEQTLAPGTLIPYRAEPVTSQLELMQAPRRRFNPLQLLRLAKTS